MRMTRILFALVISTAYISSAEAQIRPDFSGTWTLDEKRSGSPSHEAFVGPVVWIVQQASEVLIVERKRGTQGASFRYTLLDKAPATKADTVVNSTADDAARNRGYWDGDRLVIETLQTVQGKTVTTREVLALTSDGREMVVERVLEVEHGYDIKGTQNFSAVKDLFTKNPRE